MAQIIDTLAEPLLTLAGEQVIVADTTTTATYAANGVTNQSIYTVELWSPQGQQIADLSPLLLSRHFKATRNRPEVVDLSFDLGQIESYCASLGLSVQQLLGPGYNEIRIRRGASPAWRKWPCGMLNLVGRLRWAAGGGGCDAWAEAGGARIDG